MTNAYMMTLGRPVFLAVTSVVGLALPAAAQDVFRVTVAAANVREEPTTASPVIARVERGTVLRVVELEGSWVCVALPDRVGYVSLTLGTIERLPEPSAPTSPRPLPTPPAGAAEPPDPVSLPEPVSAVRPAPADSTSLSPVATTPAPAPFAAPSLAAERGTAVAQAPGLDRLDWDIRMDRARGRRKTGVYLMVGAGAGAVVGTLLAAQTAGGNNEDKGVLALIATLGASGAIAVVGAVKFVGGGRDIEFLRREGRVKGYLTIAPIDRGAMASIAFTF